MCFEVKKSNSTLCVFKNTGRFASIFLFFFSFFFIMKSFVKLICHYAFLFSEQFFLNGIDIYTGSSLAQLIGDATCKICCEMNDNFLQPCISKFCSSQDQHKQMCKSWFEMFLLSFSVVRKHAMTILVKIKYIS